MAIIPKVGRKSFRARLVLGFIYLTLTLGAVTMVYPFLLMLGTSVTSEADFNDFRPVPRYLYDETALYAKEVEARYSGDMPTINRYYGTDWANLQSVTPPEKLPNSPSIRAAIRAWNGSVDYFEGQLRGMKRIILPPVSVDDPQTQAMLTDWREFVRRLPTDYFSAGYAGWPGGPSSAPSRLLSAYKQSLEQRYGSIEALNKAYLEENESYTSVIPPTERATARDWMPDDSPKRREWLKFKSRLPDRFRVAVSLDGLYQDYLRQVKYDADIGKLNAAWGSGFGSFSQITLASAQPAGGAERADWTEFVRTQIPACFLKVKAGARSSWQSFLKQRYGSLQRLKALQKTNVASFDKIALPGDCAPGSIVQRDWMDFIAKACPSEAITVDGPENRYRRAMKSKFVSVSALNAAYGSSYESFDRIRPPYQLDDWDYTKKHTSELRKYFFGANYRLVWDFLTRHGRAVYNTLVYVFLAIASHLIVNPMCAYSLSRYNLRYGHRVLLFLLATMAFPAEVAMIPAFLLLKNFNLLNTFAALILPTMANGYSIFLLKGFFDSLPKELYEAGIIDGASEARMFWQITVPLSKPVLAVIALSSFTAAYGNFMFAFLVCQNPRMWTIMVWLYELQISSPEYVVMAALTVAAVPTLLVFVFCQNVIMRGIILPSFK